MQADAHMKALTQKNNNAHIHTASGPSSVSYVTDCQTSIFIEVSSLTRDTLSQQLC